MEEILVVGNPRKRRRHRRRKMSAKQLQYFGGRKHRRRTRRNPVSGIAALANPRRRRRSVRRSSARRHLRRARRAVARYTLGGTFRNPIGTMKPALTGAIGAAVVNTVLARVPLPAAAMTGNVRYVTQAVAAIALGAVAHKLGAGSQTAAKMAEGSLTVTLYGAVQQLAGMVGIPLSGMGYYLPGYGARAVPNPGAAPARMAGMGLYMTGPGSAGASVVPIRRAGMGGMNRIGTSFGF